MDDKAVVRIQTNQWETTRPDTKGECIPHWSRVDCGRASTSENPGGEIHFVGCFCSMEGVLMAGSMFLVSVGRHRGSQWWFWTMAQWMATRYLGGISDLLMAERVIFTNTCQWTCRASRTCPRWHIKRHPLSRRAKWICTTQSMSSIKGSAMLSSSGPSSSFAVVANEAFCGSCGYIPHVCQNWQRWTHRNAAQIPGFMKSLCIHNHTQSGRDRPKSYSCKSCSNNSEILGFEWAVAGICTSCPARAKPSITHMVTKYRSWWLW